MSLNPDRGVGSQLCPVARRVDAGAGPSYCVGVLPPPQELAKDPSGGGVHGWLARAAVAGGPAVVQPKLRSLKGSAAAGAMAQAPAIRAQVEASMCADIAELGAKLEWIAAGEEEEPAAFSVLDRLRREGDGAVATHTRAPR